jgi:hypothetical protein
MFLVLMLVIVMLLVVMETPSMAEKIVCRRWSSKSFMKTAVMTIVVMAMMVMLLMILADRAAAGETIKIRWSSESAWDIDWAHSIEGTNWILPEIGFMKNPFADPDYHEFWIGGGYVLANNWLTFIPITYFLSAADAEYVQPAFYLEARWKRLELSTLNYLWLPLEEEGVKQVLSNPTQALLEITSKFAAGVSFQAYKAESAPWQTKVGPVVRWKIRDNLNLEGVVWDGSHTEPEVQLRLTIQF